LGLGKLIERLLDQNDTRQPYLSQSV
jgi:hypothetical protein